MTPARTWPDGEGPINRRAERARSKRELADPKHRRPKGHPDDEATRDGSIDDPALQEKGDEE